MPLTRDQILQAHASGRVFQERFDSALEPWGVRARAPTLGEDISDYRRDELVRIKKLLPDDHDLKKVQIRKMPSDVLDIMEPQILKAARATANRADTVPFDAPLRKVEQRDPNGMKIITWVGQRNFIEDFKAVPRRVLGFLTPNGYFNTGGRYIR